MLQRTAKVSRSGPFPVVYGRKHQREMTISDDLDVATGISPDTLHEHCRLEL
jgi:hypothetical protein